MTRSLMVLVMALVLAAPAVAQAQFSPGAPGIGDPYFPLDGNGGYDVGHYLLDVNYTPDTDVLRGVATITATATQGLSRFDLDLDGLTVRAITVNGKPATWTRHDSELVVTPKTGIPVDSTFTTVVRYDGIPHPVTDPFGGAVSGFVATDDGAIVAGQPDVAATWFPVNDHPADKASYLFRVTLPRGVKDISNGELIRKTNRSDDTTTWVWREREPMASYLATASMGRFDVDYSTEGGRPSWNAIDPALFKPSGPHGGDRYAISQAAQASYKRLGRAIAVPAGGATLSFWVNRDTERAWDHFFVEAHTAGQDDWTTLPDLNGHTVQSTGRSCPYWLGIHPFLAHYETDDGNGTCSPTGTTGAWNAVAGRSDGYEQWKVDLSPWAGKTVRVDLGYASDDSVQYRGVFLDDIVVDGAEGSTSFESDSNGWSALGAPAGSPGNDNDWVVGTTADEPPTVGAVAKAALDRQPEIIAFEESVFGPYPFASAGGIVDDDQGQFGFALENQTRPTYATAFFTDPTDQAGPVSVVVHETMHQWTGDDLALQRWRDIWLNEGFATYAEWLWTAHEGGPSTQETAQGWFDFWSADDPFWREVVANPGPGLNLFANPVYYRGGMTLQALRNQIGDDAFFTLMKKWVARHRRGNVHTEQFISLAEAVSGQDLGDFFHTWLYAREKPASLGGEPVSTDAFRGRAPGPLITPERGAGLRR